MKLIITAKTKPATIVPVIELSGFIALPPFKLMQMVIVP